MMCVSAISLGCPKNLVDTEVMLGYLKREGYTITFDKEEAKLLIINTCAFLTSAVEESLSTIAKFKDAGKELIITGCLVDRLGDELMRRFPFLKGIVSVGSISEICEVAKGKKKICIRKPVKEIEHPFRILATMPHTSYVKIADGCDNRCSYCLIPALRGKYRSKAFSSIIAEVEGLAKIGVKEINLVAQDTTRYGYDIYGKFMLAELLKELVKVDGIEWIRILYTYPAHFTQELIDVIASEQKVCKYIDLPIQHINDFLLTRMNRRGDKKYIIGLISKLRENIPRLCIRTSIIVGHPGESEERFNELLSFLREMELEKVGVFKYSDEAGTKSSLMSEKVDERTKIKRYNRIVRLQSRIYQKRCKKMVGEELTVLVDSFQEDIALGRTQWDAPDVDEVVLIKGARGIKPGDMIKVKVTSFGEHKLFGELC